jgi:hypothetical protein
MFRNCRIIWKFEFEMGILLAHFTHFIGAFKLWIKALKLQSRKLDNLGAIFNYQSLDYDFCRFAGYKKIVDRKNMHCFILPFV